MQNWSPWQLSSATAGGSMPQPPTGSGYPAPGADPMATMQAYMQYYNQPAPSGYTAEQWAAAQQQNWTQWQQWQQQYQQWQAQYGAKYQDAMKQMSSAGVIGVPPVPVIQPPPLPKENSTAKPPLPPDTASSYNFSNNGTLPPHQNNLPLFPSKNSANPPLPLGPPPPLPDNANDGLHPGSKRNANTDILTDSAKKLKNEDDELTEAERTFDGQFKQWEEQFNKWKQQNANHPDKVQYKQYEAKWTAWREKLIERRDQMRKKREAQRAKAEAEKKKNMSGGDKILNILSSTENQGLLNNLLGIGKTLGLTGKDVAGAQSSIPSTGSVSATSSQNAMLGSQQALPVLNLSTTMTPDMNQNPWATQQWPTQYNMANMTMSGFANFQQPPSLLSLNNQPPITSTMPGFNQPTNSANPDVNFSQPPPGFNTGFNQSNSRDQDESGRRDGGSSREMPFKRDSYDQNQQNRFNDPFRGNDSFNRDNSRGINSRGMEQGSNDGRNDFSSDRFAKDERNFGSGGGSDFRSDSFAPKDRFNERVSSEKRFGDDQDRFGCNRGSFGSNFDSGSQDRLRSDDRFNSGNDRFNSGNNRFDDNKDQFGGDKSMPDDRMMSGNRFGSGSDRFGSNVNRLDSSSHSSDRRDNFGSNSRNFGKNERSDAPPEISPELKALMEKRRAAQDVFKPSGSFLSSENSTTTFESLGESFRKITGNAPFLPRDRSGDSGRMSPHGSSSRPPPFGRGPNSGSGHGPLSRPPPFAGGLDSGHDDNSSSKPPPFGGGPNSGSEFKFHDDLNSRGGGGFRSRGPGDFDSRDMRPRMGDFGPRGGNLDSRGVPPQDTSQQKVPSLEVPPWIDSNMMQSPMSLNDDTTNLNKSDAVPPGNRNDSNEKDKSLVNLNAASSPIPELMVKKMDGLPFMGENDPKPEDLNMEPPPELPDLGPVKQTNQMASEIPSESKFSGNSFERPGNFFNGPFGAPGPFGNRGMGIQGNSQGSERLPRESNDLSFGMREMGGSNFAPRGFHDAHFGSRSNQGTFGPGSDRDNRFHRDSGDFGPGSSNREFGPRNNENFGSHNVNPPFGPREHGDFGDRGPNPLLGSRDLDNFNSRAPQQFAPSDRNNFGPRDNNFGPRGGNSSFHSSDHDGFDPRSSNMGPRPRDLDDFSSRGHNPQFDMRDRAFGSDNFRPRHYDDFGPTRGGLGSNFMPKDNGAQRPMPSILNMDGPMNQSRGDMMIMDRDRPFDRFRNDMNQPMDKPMEDMRPPMAGPMPNPRDLDRRMIFPRSDIVREPHDPMGPMNRDDRPLMRSDNMQSSGRPTVAPLGPMQRSFDGPSPFKDSLIDDPRNPFSRRIDPIQPTDRPVREFCVEKQFNYNHGGGIPNEVFKDYVPSKVTDYGHIRRPMMQDYATPRQCFDYGHGKFKLRAPDHEIFPKLDFKHWVETEDNVREYNEGMRDYESRKRHSRMLMEAELRKIEPRMDDRWKRDNHREFGGGQYSSWEKTDLGRNTGSRDFEDYRDHDQHMDTRDTWDKRGRGRSRERDSEKHREERIRRSLSKDRSREKYERTRKDTDCEFSKDDERSKGNVSRQENSSKTLTDTSSPKELSYSTGKNDDSLPKTLELGKSPNYTMVDDLLCLPGRQNRPPKIAIILRGPPGSGKSFVAKLIKDKELEQGGSAPRILSLDDYFLVEKDVETTDDNGKRVINKEMVYEYEEAMESSYVVSLIKAFKKNITDGFFNFIILDAINEKISDYEELWSFAKTKGFKVYITEMDMDVAVCLKRNTHKRTEDEINRIIDYFEPTPSYHQKLDVSSLLQDNAIQEVQMEEAQASTIESHGEGNDDSQDSQDDCTSSTGVSKWEIMEAEDKLDRLDGLKRKNDGKPQTMEDFLQVPDYYNMEDNSGKKRVRWADLEEQKEQEKMRAVGFVVGQTNWDRMMDPTKGGSALTRTKYI